MFLINFLKLCFSIGFDNQDNQTNKLCLHYLYTVGIILCTMKICEAYGKMYSVFLQISHLVELNHWSEEDIIF